MTSHASFHQEEEKDIQLVMKNLQNDYNNESFDKSIEREDNISKFMVNNLDKMTCISNVIEWTLGISMVSFLFFLICLTVRSMIIFPWFYILPFPIIAILSLSIEMNMYLRLKDLFDQAEGSKGANLGSIISYFCINFICVNLLLYIVFLTLKLDSVINWKSSSISVPMFLILGTLLFYLVFILPAFIQNKLWMETILGFFIITSAFVLFVMINNKVDYNSHTWTVVSIPALTSMFFMLVYNIVLLIVKLSNCSNNLVNMIVISLFASGLVLLVLKADEILTIPYWLPMTFLIAGYIIAVFSKFYDLILGEFEDEETNGEKSHKI